MLSPLYVQGASQTRVRDDGPSLLVFTEGRATGRYPFRRLSRVVTDSRVHWTGDAVMACLKYGVPVFFNTPNGNFIGSCYGNRRREAKTDNLLQLASSDPAWHSEFDTWFRSIDQQEAQRCARALALRACGHSTQAIYNMAVNGIYRRWRLPPAKHMKAYAGYLRPWVEQQLIDMLECTGDDLAYSVAGLHMGERFATLSRWAMIKVLYECRDLPEADDDCNLWSLQCFEDDLPEHGKSLGRLLGKFEYWLRGHAL